MARLFYLAFMIFISGGCIYVFGTLLGKIWDSDDIKIFSSKVFKIFNTISLILVFLVLGFYIIKELLYCLSGIVIYIP